MGVGKPCGFGIARIVLVCPDRESPQPSGEAGHVRHHFGGCYGGARVRGNPQIDSAAFRPVIVMPLFCFASGRCSMSSLQRVHLQTRVLGMGRDPNADCRLEEHVLRALNKIKKPSTPEEITELLNRDLGPGDRPFQVREIATWLRSAADKVLSLYWLGSRPRR